MKFKVDDLVRVINNINGHGFKIGKEARIIEAKPIIDSYTVSDGNNCWYLSSKEMLLVDEGAIM